MSEREGPAERRGDGSSYTFGDSELAASRLARVAANFEPASRPFLERAAPRDAVRALDLGCGPGHTTRLLRDVCAPRETLGLDASDAFVRLAGATPEPGLAFAVHDVTRVPFPGGAADLIYARLLLAHLPEPEALVVRWRSQLRSGGRLLLDEVESIRTGHPVLLRYLGLVTHLLASRGLELYVGARLEAATRGAGRSHCMLREHALTTARAAGMFVANLAEIRVQPAVRERASEAELDGLADDLRALADGGAGDPVTWALRQVALEA
jgi:trans-aconitate 2-methyltransferase